MQQNSNNYPRASRESDLAREKDRAYFEQHPDRTSYLREVVVGEFDPFFVPPRTLILVTQLEPGVRCRQVLPVELEVP